MLRGMAFEMLEEFGDAGLGEWYEDRPKAFHLRRRLSADEAKRVGDAVDCRGTREGMDRFRAIEGMLHPAAIQLAKEELQHDHPRRTPPQQEEK